MCKHFSAFCPTFTSIFISFVDCGYLFSFLLVVLKFYSEYHLALNCGTIVTFLNVIQNAEFSERSLWKVNMCIMGQPDMMVGISDSSA